MRLSKMQIDAIVNKVATELRRINNIKKEEILSKTNYAFWLKNNNDIVKDIVKYQELSNRYSDKVSYYISYFKNDRVESVLQELFEKDVLRDKDFKVNTKDIENKIILQTINKDFDVDVFIQQLINEFSN